MSDKPLYFMCTKERAQELGLLVCTCGHLESVHHWLDIPDRSGEPHTCSHCDCSQYTEKTADAGKFVEPNEVLVAQVTWMREWLEKMSKGMTKELMLERNAALAIKHLDAAIRQIGIKL